MDSRLTIVLATLDPSPPHHLTEQHGLVEEKGEESVLFVGSAVEDSSSVPRTDVTLGCRD